MSISIDCAGYRGLSYYNDITHSSPTHVHAHTHTKIKHMKRPSVYTKPSFKEHVSRMLQDLQNALSNKASADILNACAKNLEHYILTCDIIEFTQSLIYRRNPKDSLLTIIIYHVLSVKTYQQEKYQGIKEHIIEFKQYILTVLQDLCQHGTFKQYLEIYYNNKPEKEVFSLIKKIWYWNSEIEMTMKLLYCEELLLKYKTEKYRRILFGNKEHFLLYPEGLKFKQLYGNCADVYATVLFHLSLPCNHITVDVKTTRSALTQLQSTVLICPLKFNGYLYKEIRKYLGKTFEDTFSSSEIDKLFNSEWIIHPESLKLHIILLHSKTLKIDALFTEYYQLRTHHQELILSSVKYITYDTHEDIRQQYCETLLDMIQERVIPMDISKAAFSTLLNNEIHNDLYKVLEHFMTKSEKNLIFTATTLIDLIQCRNEMDGKINKYFRDEQLKLLLIIKCSKQLMDKKLKRENTQMLKRHNLFIMLNVHLVQTIDNYRLSFHGSIRDIKKQLFIPPEDYSEVLFNCGLYGDIHKETILTLLENDLHKHLFNAFIQFMGKFDNEVIVACLKLLDSFPSSRNKDATLKLIIIVKCFKNFIKTKYNHKTRQMIIQYRDLILSKAGTFDNGNEYTIRGFLHDVHDDDYIPFSDDDDYDVTTPCEYRQQFSLILLHLLHYSHSSQKQTTEVETAIQQFKTSLLNKEFEECYCYCYRGSSDCKMSKKDTKQERGVRNQKSRPGFHIQIKQLANTFSRIIQVICHKSFGIDTQKYIAQALEEEVMRLVKYLNDTEQLEFISYGLTTCFDKLDNKKILKIGIIKLLQFLCRTKLKLETKDLIVQGIANVLPILYYKDYVNLSRLILDVNLMANHYETLNLKYFTLKLGEMFEKKEDKINSEEKVIYQCFCVLRHENKYRDKQIVNTDIYKKHFKFISTMEKEEEIERLASLLEFLVMMVFLLSCVANGGHNTSAELKKYLSLKYAYDNAILYLLWCSGDVEINPGPTLKKLQKVPPSIKERNWIHDTCSTTLKGLKGISNDTNLNKDLWGEPDNWPPNERFYDPRNPKGFKRNNETDKRLLECLHECCQAKNISLPTHLEEEMKAWKSGTKHLLFELYISRQEINVNKGAAENLHQYRDSLELKTCLSEVNIPIDFASVTFHPGNHNSKSKAEVQRDLIVTLGRISKGLNPLEKSDGLWKCPPDNWDCKNYQLYTNADAKRSGVEENRELINELIRYCEQNNKNIPVDCQPMIAAWKQNKMEEVCKLHSIWSNITTIQHSLTYLEVEEVLDKPTLKKELKDIGLNIDKLDFLRCQTVLKSKVPKSWKRSSNLINKSKKTLSQTQSEQTKQTGQQSLTLNIKNVATSSTAGGCNSQQSQPKQKSKGKKSTSQNKTSNKRKKSFSQENEEEDRKTKKLILSKDETNLFLEVVSSTEQHSILLTDIQNPIPGFTDTQNPLPGVTDTQNPPPGVTDTLSSLTRTNEEECDKIHEYGSKTTDNQATKLGLETYCISSQQNGSIMDIFLSNPPPSSTVSNSNGPEFDNYFISIPVDSGNGTHCEPASALSSPTISCKEPKFDSPPSSRETGYGTESITTTESFRQSPDLASFGSEENSPTTLLDSTCRISMNGRTQKSNQYNQPYHEQTEQDNNIINPDEYLNPIAPGQASTNPNRLQRDSQSAVLITEMRFSDQNTTTDNQTDQIEGQSLTQIDELIQHSDNSEEIIKNMDL